MTPPPVKRAVVEKNVALDVYDAVWQFGHKPITCREWVRRFRPTARYDSGCRSWERFKVRLREQGYPHELRRGEGGTVDVVLGEDALARANAVLDGLPLEAEAEVA